MAGAFQAIFAAIILVLSATAPTAAGPLEDAVAAEVKADYATALRLYRQLADQVIARARLGAEGKRVSQNYAEAIEWYRRAAVQGNVDAQYFLGSMFALGQGVPQDDVSAYIWFDLAAAQGNVIAEWARDTIAERMNPEQIAEALKLARE